MDGGTGNGEEGEGEWIMIRVRAEQALEALREVVQEKGLDYKYVSPGKGVCAYVHEIDGGNVPGCLIGHVMLRQGWASEAVLLESNEETVNALVEKNDLDFSTAAVELLREAQAVQDEFQTWGEALAAAEKYLEVVGEEEDEDAPVPSV